jgi:hypothetical protein
MTKITKTQAVRRSEGPKVQDPKVAHYTINKWIVISSFLILLRRYHRECHLCYAQQRYS